MFWAGFEQAGASLNLFADRHTDRMIFGWDMPAGVLQGVNPAFIIIFAPVFAAIWVQLGKRNWTRPRRQVRARPDPDGRRLPGDVPRRALRRDGRESAADLADAHLPAAHLRRAVPEPGRPELDDQARAGALRRPGAWACGSSPPRSATTSPASSPASSIRTTCRACRASSSTCSGGAAIAGAVLLVLTPFISKMMAGVK